MEPYNKSTKGYFPDFADDFNFGISSFGNKFSTTNRVVNNPIKWEDTLNGSKNPSWRSQVRNGLSATTTMNAQKQSVAAYPMLAYFTYSQLPSIPGEVQTYGMRGYPFYQMPNDSTVPTDVLSTVKNRALRKFLSAAQSARSSIEGGQNLGEWKELVHGVTNPLGALRKFTLGHILKSKKTLKRKRKGISLKKALADTYLEFTFGWNPLVSDVANAMVGLQTRFDRFDQKRIRGSAQTDYDGSSTEVQVFQRVSNRLRIMQSVQIRGTVTRTYIGVVRTGAVDGTMSRKQVLGLLPERFIPTIWELIPYSFVVDYFVNIGDIINSLAFRDANVIWSQVTDRRTVTSVYSDVYPKITYDSGLLASTKLLGVTASGGRASLQRRVVSRQSVQPSDMLPDFQFHWPVSNKPWVNIGAILLGKLR